ncbi:glutamyl-tRNA reductase [Flavobacterium sp. CSZ]|uniref:glutamyl-tRNA reductase n=1 Tax=Flavobacterium sp. CSZ TaxID=2783791 RepID=UPI00188A57D7|nr:glutamyl-tRNA reductase [Flavobacterium sp. CSZ]MBF4488119.1 glutamyl-tRNA reductase [Flavobacterium sp. CSZ]
MENFNMSKTTTFYALGLSYKKADAAIRGKFSLDAKAQSDLLAQAKTEAIESLIVTSTCNRTEIYGFANHPYELIKLLCENSKGSVEEFQEVAYIYKNQEAINHMFRVATGLDSQILGDFEIVSQIKIAFNHSKGQGLINTFLDRLVNSVIQASKKIKTDTEISSGATSVSFASVQYIIRNVQDIVNKKIVLFGTGKIGRNTCENLVKHTKNGHITLINRTKSKAEVLAGKLNVIVKDFVSLEKEIQQADVLVVATGAQNPTIDKTSLNLKKPLLILDLSIPRNVNPDVEEIPGVSLIHLDYLSQITDDTLERRKQHIPAAEAIIEDMKLEFNTWINGRKYAPTIHSLKAKLSGIVADELAFQKKKTIHFDQTHVDLITSRVVQKITSHFATHLKNENTSLDESIEFIEKVFQIGPFEQKNMSRPIEEKYKINLS